MDGFVHLHVHSHFSLLDGACRIEDLVETAAKHGSPAIAITDHGNMFGAVEFYKAAKAAGIKPILGMEAYISPTTRHDKSMGSMRSASYHLVLLAMNQTGFLNLMKLSSRAYTEGFYYRPRVDRELLSEFNEGIICTSACLGGELPQALLNSHQRSAQAIAADYIEIFGKDRFFIEIQQQGIDEQNQVNPMLVELASEMGVGIVGTNDTHFLNRTDKAAHEVLTCISTNKTLAETHEAYAQGAKRYYTDEMYLKSPAEMREALKEWPEACDNTLKIAEMCDVELDFSKKHLPVFITPNEEIPEQYLRDIAWQGLDKRFEGKEIPDEYKQRLERELQVIEDKGYSSYFLIVNDFVQYAHANSIPSSPRGSGVATLLGYVLGIADVDPLQYGLLFERFTDPQRDEDPDIDIDICQEGRAKLIQYVREKYGHVAQIITYGRLKAKAAIRDVGRVLDIPLAEVNVIAKLIPDELKITVDKALKLEPDLAKMYRQDERITQLLDFARQIEGLTRNSGIHAAGVIVCQEPLETILPLYRTADCEDVITQWDGPTSEEAGLMKMDFLGLRTLTIIQRARELVTARIGQDVDPEKIPLDEPEVYELFQEGLTDGVFQFESDGMKNVLRQMRPEKIEGLIAANAMYRPGPMELIPTYCARKNGLEDIPSVHELVDELLAETYGIMAYQEQVMQVLNRLGKLPLNRALTLIKAISKKKYKVIESERPNFVQGAGENGISADEANTLFELILKFAGYGFNKAHSTRYAIVAYQTAYFKYHYPREFLAATLTFECADSEKVVQYMAEASRLGIKILPPDINTCSADFTVDGEDVRFGLAAVKGVGHKAIDAIVTARQEVEQFENLYHFCEFVDLSAVNRATVEALIKCGAFDSMGAHRAAMIAGLEQAIQLGQSSAADRKSGQMSFFDAFGQNEPENNAPVFPKVEPWSETQLLQAEKETIGLYITSHPLVHYAREVAGLTMPRSFELVNADNITEGIGVTLGCMIVSVRSVITKKGDKMAMVTVEDLTGKCDAVVFPRTYTEISEHLVADNMVFIIGALEKRNDRSQIVINEVVPIDEAIEKLTGRVVIRIGATTDAALLEQLRDLIAEHRGTVPVFFETRPLKRSDVIATVRPGSEWSVQPSRQLMDALVELLGDQNALSLHPKRMKPPEAKGGKMKFYKKDGVKSSAKANVSAAVTRFD